MSDTVLTDATERYDMESTNATKLYDLIDENEEKDIVDSKTLTKPCSDDGIDKIDEKEIYSNENTMPKTNEIIEQNVAEDIKLSEKELEDEEKKIFDEEKKNFEEEKKIFEEEKKIFEEEKEIFKEEKEIFEEEKEIFEEEKNISDEATDVEEDMKIDESVEGQEGRIETTETGKEDFKMEERSRLEERMEFSDTVTESKEIENVVGELNKDEAMKNSENTKQEVE